MLKVIQTQDAIARASRLDTKEFRLVIAIAMCWFLMIAFASRVLPRAWRPLASPGKVETPWAEAKRTAHTVVPYAFMRW
jgi:hypothetical protein